MVFISRDPLSGAEFSQGTNLYAYCRNSFLNACDPTGMCFSSDGDSNSYAPNDTKGADMAAATQHFEDEGYPSWMASGMADAGSWASDNSSSLQTTNNVLMAAQMADGAGELEAAGEGLIDAGEAGFEGLGGMRVKDTTNPGASVPNFTTKSTAEDASGQLSNNGFNSTQINENVTQFLDDSGNMYNIRPSNSAPGGQAADFTPAGSNSPTMKLNFGTGQ